MAAACPSQKGKVTFCVPVFNGAKTLERALESLKALDLPGYSVFLADNASIDATWEIALRYQRKFPDLFRTRRNERNLGFSGNFRRCIESADGDYLFFLGADDLIGGNEVGSLAAYLDAHPGVGIVSGDLALFHGHDVTRLKYSRFFSGEERYFPAGDAAVEHWLFHSSLASIGGYLVRRSAALEFLDRIPARTIIPQVFLGGMICVRHSAAHVPVVTFRQCLTNDTTQLANEQYLSLDSVRDIFRLIDDLTSENVENEIVDKLGVGRRTKVSVSNAFVPNIVSYRVFCSWRMFLGFIRILAVQNPRLLFSPSFLTYFVLSLLIPKVLLREMLFLFRRSGGTRSSCGRSRSISGDGDR